VPLVATTSLQEALASIANIMFPEDDIPREIFLSTRAADGDSPLHVFAWRKDIHAARLALVAGADPNAVGDMGETALHVAVRKDLPGLVRALLEAGASPDTVSEFGESPRQMAAGRGGEVAAVFSQFGT
jgi:uncharacterized protein